LLYCLLALLEKKVQILTGEEVQGTLVVARDIAHAKLKERLDEGKGLPDYVKNHLIYYAGPAKTPQGICTRSFYYAHTHTHTCIYIHNI
jgi:tartrate dehydratase beta subunit/fumarate hydratase class I family protein